MATLYRANGTEEEITPADGHGFTLEELQALVGGFIEMVTLGISYPDRKKERKALIIDEEGKLKNKPVNDLASVVWHSYATRAGLMPDHIVGDAVLVLVTGEGTDAERVR